MKRVLWVGGLVLIGCAGSSSFVRNEELQKIGQRPRPSKIFEHPIAKVDTWELQGPLATQTGHGTVAATTPLDALLVSSAQGRYQPAQDLTCVARERARFAASNEGEPPRLLNDFIESRCGVAGEGAHLRLLGGEVDDARTEDELLTHWGPQISQMLAEVPQGSFAGIALARSKGKATLALAMMHDDAQLEPIELVPSGKLVVIKGTMLRPAQSVFGAINDGDSKAADCVRHADVALPRFELECPVPANDERAWLEIGYREPDRYLGSLLSRQIVFPRGAASATWSAPTLAEPLPSLAPDAFVAGLNKVRTRLGIGPVALSAPESTTASAVAPHYFLAETTGDTRLADQIARGLTAGWQVTTPISDGDIGIRVVSQSTTFLAELLESPGNRSSLLSPQTTTVAVGVWEDPSMTGALVMSYRGLHAVESLAGLEAGVIKKLNDARAKAGQAVSKRVQLPGGLTDQIANAVRSGKMSPTEGLDELMETTAQMTRQRVNGWHIQTGDLDELEWPTEMITRPELQVMFMLTIAKRPDEPFTRYHLLFALMSGVNTTLASR